MRQPFMLMLLLDLGVLPVLPRRKESADAPFLPPETEAQREERLHNERQARVVNFGAPVQMRERRNPYTGEYEFEFDERRIERRRRVHESIAVRVACAGPAMLPKVKRDRQAQRETSKGRKATKKRRGW